MEPTTFEPALTSTDSLGTSQTRNHTKSRWSTVKRRFKSGATNPTTKGALAVAGTVLVEVASATQSVPYIEAVSSVISHIVKIHEEVATLKEKRESVMVKVLQLRKIVDDVDLKLGPGANLPPDLKEPFALLEGVLNGVLDMVT